MKILFIRITIEINTYETYYFLVQKLFRRKIFTKILEIKISIFICSFQKKKRKKESIFLNPVNYYQRVSTRSRITLINPSF